MEPDCRRFVGYRTNEKGMSTPKQAPELLNHVGLADRVSGTCDGVGFEVWLLIGLLHQQMLSMCIV